jgi:phage tail-like protein
MSQTTFVDFLYNKLPAVYREEDSKLGSPLYRYLQSLSEGGFEKALSDVDGFLSLVDPETCPDEIFPYLYESFGLPYYQDIDISYHRRFLSNIGALMKRRGTNRAVKYLVSTLTGFDVVLSYDRRYEDDVCVGRFLNIAFLVDTIEEAIMVKPSAKVIEQFIKTEIPFYITPSVSALLSTEVLQGYVRRAGVMSSSITAKVLPFAQQQSYSFTGSCTHGICICQATYNVLMPEIN